MEIRSISPEEFRAYASVWERTFNFDGKDEELEVEAKHHELDRSIVAIDGEDFVGTGGAFSFEMTVPGGSVPAAGLTAIAVLPTHRRRGVLTSMMRYHFDDVQEREEPVAILRASESVIYGRFGYGVATRESSWKLGTRDSAFVVENGPGGSVSLIASDRAREVMPEIYGRAAIARPGFLSRSEEIWDLILSDLDSWRGGFTANRYGLYEEDGVALGYVRYRAKDTWDHDIPKNEILASELMALNPKAEAELWRFMFSLDLVETVKTQNRPTDDLLQILLADPRRLSSHEVDGLWARLVDVPAALTARRYRTEGRLVIEVVDPTLPDRGGRFLLEGGPDGAECRSTGNEPDLIVDPVALGSCYLGGGSFSSHQSVGRVSGSMEAIRLADTMFSWHRAPWCPHYF
ncbi:MAG: GNAT family N-acetyltransferase [Acidimicrobiia bacterium]|nr:GNAT family N-acetyltransferase [Acidimicrobiia bacterium]